MDKDLNISALKCENTLIKNTDRVRCIQYNPKTQILTGLKNINEIFQIHFKTENKKLQIAKSHFQSFKETEHHITASAGSSHFYRNYVPSLYKKHEKKDDQDSKIQDSFFKNNKPMFSFINQDQDHQASEADSDQFQDHVYFSTSDGQLFRYYYHDQSLEKKMTLPSPVVKLVSTQVKGEEKIIG